MECQPLGRWFPAPRNPARLSIGTVSDTCAAQDLPGVYTSSYLESCAEGYVCVYDSCDGSDRTCLTSILSPSICGKPWASSLFYLYVKNFGWDAIIVTLKLHVLLSGNLWICLCTIFTPFFILSHLHSSVPAETCHYPQTLTTLQYHLELEQSMGCFEIKFIKTFWNWGTKITKNISSECNYSDHLKTLEVFLSAKIEMSPML